MDQAELATVGQQLPFNRSCKSPSTEASARHSNRDRGSQLCRGLGGRYGNPDSKQKAPTVRPLRQACIIAVMVQLSISQLLVGCLRYMREWKQPTEFTDQGFAVNYGQTVDLYHRWSSKSSPVLVRVSQRAHFPSHDSDLKAVWSYRCPG